MSRNSLIKLKRNINGERIVVCNRLRLARLIRNQCRSYCYESDKLYQRISSKCIIMKIKKPHGLDDISDEKSEDQ